MQGFLLFDIKEPFALRTPFISSRQISSAHQVIAFAREPAAEGEALKIRRTLAGFGAFETFYLDVYPKFLFLFIRGTKQLPPAPPRFPAVPRGSPRFVTQQGYVPTVSAHRMRCSLKRRAFYAHAMHSSCNSVEIECTAHSKASIQCKQNAQFRKSRMRGEAGGGVSPPGV